MSVAVQRRRFTVEEYHQMGAAGLFSADERVELINGEILKMPPIGPSHMSGVNRTSDSLSELLHGRVIVSVQNPIALSEDSEPQPDVAILVRHPDFYRSALPQPKDVLLLIEVADASLDFDQEVKIPMYARARIREVWLLDLANQALHVYRRPRRGEYTIVHKLGPEDRVSPEAFPDVEIEVGQLLS